MRHRAVGKPGAVVTMFRPVALVLTIVLFLSCGGDRPASGRVNSRPHGSAAAVSSVTVLPPGWAFPALPNAYSMALTARAGPGPGGRRVLASWTYINGMEGLNAQVDAWLLGILDPRAGAQGGRYRPAMALDNTSTAAAGAATILTARPVMAAGTVIAYRETEQDTGPDGVSTLTSATFFADTGNGEVHPAEDLLTPAAVPVLYSRATDEMRLSAGPSTTAVTLSDMLLDDQGVLTVTAARPGSSGRGADVVRISIGANEAGPMMSGFGRYIMNQARAHAPVTGQALQGPGFRHINCDLVPCAALTYDDGPAPRTTPQLLGILQRKNALATFFMQGTNAAANPGIAKQLTDAGHAGGNHTYSHPDLTMLTAAGIKREIDSAAETIRAATGRTPRYMRPPYGAANAAVQKAVGLPLILWSVDSLDWLSKDPAVFVPKVLKEITPGAVVLMHDVHAPTIAGQTELITTLQNRGYHLVTVDQLFQGTPLIPGRVYRSRPERP
jgi:peptidoglycan/xylan/chitin deacetylase (PgdA/CDA1 family)